MNKVSEFFHGNLFSIVSVLAVAGWMLFLLVMDARHEAKGVAAEVTVESELRAVRREKRQIQNYLDSAPSEQYDAARQATLRELVDEEKELTETLDKIR